MAEGALIISLVPGWGDVLFAVVCARLANILFQR